jgi:hypothetical protein
MNHKFNLENKNILFICRNYFGYESEILSILKNNNNVFHLLDVPYKSNFLKILIRFFPSIFFKRTNKIYERLIKNSNLDSLDYVFVIIGETVSPKFLTLLKQTYPNVKLILYIWDSINNNRRNLVSRFHFYDNIFCFQKEDAIKYNINFLPLFYIDSYKKINHSLIDAKIDLCFVGTAHADRPKIIQELVKRFGSERKIFTFLYLQAKWLYWIYKFIYPPYRNIKMEILNFDKLRKEDIIEVYNNSKIIIDIQHPKQTGLTIRTFEVLASGSKLVTTNADIKNYDFYNKNQICIIDRNKPDIPYDFFENNDNFSNEYFLNNYSLNNWLNKIF